LSAQQQPATGTNGSGIELPASGTAALWIHLPWLLLFVAVFAPTGLWLWERLTISIWQNGHGLFIPLIVGWLIYDRLRKSTVEAGASSALGFVFLLPAMLVVVLDAGIRTQILSAIALVIALPGISLLLLGVRQTRALAFPFLLAFFVLPIPAGAVAPVHLLLRHISAWSSAEFLSALGISVVRDGTLLLIPRGTVLISDACSGFSTFYAAMTLAFILAYLATSMRRRLLIVAGAAVLAIACNVVRVTALVLMCHFYGFELLDTSLHEGSGLVAFAATLVLLFALAERRPPIDSTA